MKTQETKNKFEEVANTIDALGVEMDDLKGGINICASGRVGAAEEEFAER